MLFLGYGCNINNHIYLSRLTSLSVPLHRDLLIELLNVHSLIGRLVCTSINTAFASVILPSIEVLCVGERACSRGPSQVLRRHIPALLSRLLGPVLELGLLPGFAGCSNFLLTGSNFTSIEVLNELVHFRDPFVVFLEGANLAIEQAVLLVAHLEVLLEALDTISNPIDPADDADGMKDAYIVFAFAIFGILFDVISIFFFARNAKLRGDRLGINMLAAFAHVGADLARSITTFVESILILLFGFKFTITDAWACCIVSATILIGCFGCTVEWIIDFWKCCKEGGQARENLVQRS